MAIEKEQFFLDLVRNNPILKDFENDLGLILIAKSLNFKITEALQDESKFISNLYNPTTENELLAFLMYKVGYIRFKKPLQIKALITNKDVSSIILNKDTKFTDGQNVYFLNDAVSLDTNIPKDAYFTLKEKYVKEVQLNSNKVFFHIPLGTTYKKFVECEVKALKNGSLLEYSQNFIKLESEVSYEIDLQGNMSAVIQLANTFANNLTQGDILEVTTIVSGDITTQPRGLSIIQSGYNLGIDNISIHQNYNPPMDIDEMQDYIKFGRKNLGDLVLNEDFRQFFLTNIPNLEVIKVWQERTKTVEYTPDISYINKVFCCYIDKQGSNNNPQIDIDMKKIFNDYMSSREIIIERTEIFPITVFITIKTNEVFYESYKNEIKSNLVGYYDDIHKILNQTISYKKVFEIVVSKLKVFSIDLAISDKQAFSNTKIFHISDANVNIVVDTL